jgi:hypothetical protein
MVKAPKPTIVADSKPLQSTPNDWMPLIPAFLHIQQVVGGEELAEEELRQRLVSGDVEAQDRRVTPGKGIEIMPLTPKDIEDGLLFPRLPERIGVLHREAHRRDNLLRRVERLRADGHNFFLRGVYRIWPIAGDAEERRARMPRRMDAAEKPQVPSTVQKAADAVLDLTRDGHTWVWGEREALLTKVRELTGKKSLSLSTLKRALRHLRDEGLITKSGIATLVPIGSEPK